MGRVVVSLDITEHRALARWAADCAEHVLLLFEQAYPGDDRPRRAVQAARAWADGERSVVEVREAAFAAHDAARETTDPAARAAARAAGRAASTAHAPGHAARAATYAATAASIAGVAMPAASAQERKWQHERLPDGLDRMAFRP
jgi:hypothetical protein